MNYQQLTERKRYQISLLVAQGFTPAEISRSIGVHRATVGRELKRNSRQGIYCPDMAQKKASFRRKNASKYRVSEETLIYVEWTLSLDWSPEQISEVGKQIGYRVSHEWIYRHVAADRALGGQLYKHLRQGHKRYRRGKNGKRSVIPDPVYIDDRPAIVEERSRIGDWEVDTVMGKQGTGAIVSLAERSSRLYLIRKLEVKSAEAVADAMIEMLKPYAAHVHTITADNGSEFVAHKKVAEALDADVFFAHPYSAWERGLNENFNGLLRQYIPKGTDLRGVTDEQITEAQQRINLRPRKCLGFQQPQKVFNDYLKAVEIGSVALQS